MFDIFIEKIKAVFSSRLFAVLLIYIVLFFILIQRIFVIQIVNGEKYESVAEQKITKEREIKGTRGNILDRNGKILAHNALSNTVTYEDTGVLTTNEEKNAMIYRLIKIIEENGGTLNDDFFILMDKDGNLSFKSTGSAELRFKRDVFSLSSIDQLEKEQEEATAEQMFHYMRYGYENSKNKMYGITDEYSKEDALKIMMIRFNILMNKYSRYLPITIASNVNDVTAAAIRENKEELPGVEILSQTKRVYNYSEEFAHIMGYTGLISQDKLAELKEKGDESYSATDQIGITGVEKEFEEYLHGTNGSETVIVNDQTRVLDILEKKEPVAGNDVYLTLDADLQKSVYNLLERNIAGILLNAIRSNDNLSIKDVFFALINNNVLDIAHFNDREASDLEKKVYRMFRAQQKKVFSELKNDLKITNQTPNKSLSDRKKEYIDYLYSMLIREKVLLTSKIDSEDKILQSYLDGRSSLSSFLKYAISNNYIDLTKLDVGDKYYSTEELYKKLSDYIFELIEEDSNFNKIIYKELVYSSKLSGKEICLLLFDQNVLKYDEKSITGLENGTIAASNFITDKIKSLEITPAQLALEPCSGSVVVTDVKSGEVLALVSYPGYDNNMLANQVNSAYYSKLLNDKSYPLINRPQQTRTAPGSTYKMLSAITGLEEGVITPNETILDQYVFTKIVPSPKGHTKRSYGKIGVPKALEVSSNYFFYEVGYRLGLNHAKKYVSELGLKKLREYAEKFGFNKTSGIELPEYDPKISDIDSVRSAIGQGTNAYTPSQLAKYVTAIANKGTCYDLTIFNYVKDINKKVINKNKELIENQITIKDSSWNLVHQGMHQVVYGENSSIKPLYKDLEVKVGGKTGTAQESKTKPDHALFVSYAPFDDPEISVVVVIPNGYTSGNAAELARNVYKYYYKEDGYKEMLTGKVNYPQLSRGVSD